MVLFWIRNSCHLRIKPLPHLEKVYVGLSGTAEFIGETALDFIFLFLGEIEEGREAGSDTAKVSGTESLRESKTHRSPEDRQAVEMKAQKTLD